MNSQDKTKEELLTELQKLQKEHDLLKKSRLKDLADYKQTEQKLQKSEETWRKLVTTIPDYIALHSIAGNYIFLNHYAEGFSEKDVIGKSVYDYISEDSQDEYRRNFDVCLQTKQTQRVVYNAFGNNGVIRLYESFLIPIMEKDVIVSLMSFAVDITDRNLAETALKESEARFRSLFDNSLMGISVTSPDGRLLQANLAYARMYGYETPEKMYTEITDIGKLYLNQADRKSVLKELCMNGKMEEREFEVVRRDGSSSFVMVSASEVRNLDGKLLYNQATHIDITERKKIEEKIRNASLYARSLLEASLDPLVTINAEGKVTDVNLSTEQITGISREKLIGSDFADFFSNPAKARKGCKIVFSKGVVKDYPLTIIHNNGRKIDVLYNATLFKNEAGKVQGVFAAARDITDRKKMESELRNSKILLEKLNQHLQAVRENERSQIAMNLHDDLGQRLTALYLDMAWIKSRIGVQSPAVTEKIEEMRVMINDTIEGIKEISSFLRPTILYDLGLVPAITSLLGKFENQSGIKCYFYPDPEEFKIEERISLILFRIIQESLTNIARHSGASSMVISLRFLKKKAEMSIKDNGVGIDHEKVNSLTSMGLEGIRERVRSVNGRVSIKGEKGSGTTIDVSIPLNIKSDND